MSQKAGDLKQAKLQLKESLQMVCSLLEHGDHPDVAATLDDLWFVSFKTCDLVQAKQHLEECLGMSCLCDRNLPDIAASLHALGEVYHDIDLLEILTERSSTWRSPCDDTVCVRSAWAKA